MRSRAFILSILFHLVALFFVLRAVQRRSRPPTLDPITLIAPPAPSPPAAPEPPPRAPPPTLSARPHAVKPSAPSAAPQTERPAAPAAPELPIVGGTLSNVGEGGGTLSVVEGEVGAPIGAPRDRILGRGTGGAGGGGPSAAIADEPGCRAAATRPTPLDRPSEIELTSDARASGVEGRLVLRLTIATDGSVANVAVLQSVEPSLDSAAIATVKGWRFRPAQRCGHAVEASYTVARRFELGD